ncbi:MAG: ABC transporter permease [Pseudomonadales bacterium]
MSSAVRIAREEWRQWLRSRLAVLSLMVFAILLLFTTILTALDAQAARHERLHQQEQAEQTFLDQPDRHPHRMVHYGHYVFRTPPPLAMFDPGVDAVTGQSLFLEGHRQNSAMFADARAEARTGGFGALTPAKLYHLFLPLLIIALGHGVILREREARTLGPLLSQGVTGARLYHGKLLALGVLIALLSLPALFSSVAANLAGESLLASATLFLGNLLYLGIWAALTLLLSTMTRSRGVALGVLAAAWVLTVLVIPRIGVTSASAALPSEGKILTDMRMNDDLRKLGDGHNAADPAFAQLRANLLAQYNVDSVEALPVNFRGIVAAKSEVDMTQTLNAYAEQRMQREQAQAAHLSTYGWASPYLAIAGASRNLAGTDLATHHRFLREAEAVRFDFVDGLNKAHAEQLSYVDDMNRNNGEEGWKRARINAANWQVLNDFRFTPASAMERVNRASAKLMALATWFVALVALGLMTARRLTP